MTASPLVDEMQASIAISESERRYLMARRQSIIIELGGLEEYLGLDRSIVPKRKREAVELRDKFVKLTEEQRR